MRRASWRECYAAGSPRSLCGNLAVWGYLSRWRPSFSERRPWPAYRDWSGRTGIKTGESTRHKSVTKLCLGLKTLLASSSHSLEINGPARTANLGAPVGYTSSAISTRVCSLRGRAQRTKSGTDSAARVAAGQLMHLKHTCEAWKQPRHVCAS